MNRESGYLSIYLVFLLLFIAVLAFGVAILTSQSYKPLEDVGATLEEGKAILDAKAAFDTALAEDSTPEVDSTTDPVFSLDGAVIDGYTLYVEDESSKLNLNWERPVLLAQSAIVALLNKDKTMDELVTAMAKAGPVVNFGATYGEYFEASILRSNFGAFSYANVNTSSPGAIKSLIATRTGDLSTADSFAARVSERQRNGQLWSDDELRFALGSTYKKLSPLVTVQAQMNVNFAPETVLRAVMRMVYEGDVNAPYEPLLSALFDMRKSTGVTPTTLRNLLPVHTEQQKVIFAYLGTRTWFWSVEMKGPVARRMILCMVEDASKPSSASARKSTLIEVEALER